MEVKPTGPANAKIMIVGEAPGADEVRAGAPFVGAAGQELDRMLQDAGIRREQCFVTNVCRIRPPGNDITAFMPKSRKLVSPTDIMVQGRYVRPALARGVETLCQEIDAVKPNVIVTLGNTSLWALTGNWGITKWRGSQLEINLKGRTYKVVPTYHPAAILRQYDWRFIAVHDLRKAAAESLRPELTKPAYKFIIRPSFAITTEILSELIRRAEAGTIELAVDLETRGGRIACIGLAWSPLDAICVPLMSVKSPEGYWDYSSELLVVSLLCRLLCHPNVRLIGQNMLYDCQYFAKEWGIMPKVEGDTMLLHHVLFPGLLKSLDFLSSLYLPFHQYWKDEGKEWNASMPEDQLWIYNCRDAVAAWAVYQQVRRSLCEQHLVSQAAFQMGLFPVVLRMMLRGVRIDLGVRQRLHNELAVEMRAREQFFIDVLGHPLNPRSPKQMHTLFYEDFAQPPIYARSPGPDGERRRTLDAEALVKLGQREPLLRPLIRRISEYRSLGVFKSTFVDATLDSDQRMRCSFNIAGTETFRFSSSENAFGSGTNLQNIPKGSEDEDSDLVLPNVRKLFIPDPDCTFFDADLDRADLQVVVWEADDAELKEMLRAGIDLHTENAKTLLGKSSISKAERQLTKVFIHGTDYGGSARTMASNCGVTVHQAEIMQRRWFGAHPGIRDWQARVLHDLQTKRQVTNAFGYRRFYFDRIEGLLPEALAWIPQSTVAIVINKGIQRLSTQAPIVQVLLQVHDSAAGQFPTAQHESCVPAISKHLRIVVPYDDPLIIPVNVKTSVKSWGDCE
jgi:uracil-DNA glycosylase